MARLGTTRQEPGSKNKQQDHFTVLLIYIKAKLIKLSEWLSLSGASL